MQFSDKVVYQIYPKSFCDSNGDGLGDIRGIIGKLDYIASLGVDYIWSTPFFVSPMNDNGYDVANYREIDPCFGTMADVEELIAEADKRGLGLMFNMVFNHTSTEHEWFQRALRGEKNISTITFSATERLTSRRQIGFQSSAATRGNSSRNSASGICICST